MGNRKERPARQRTPSPVPLPDEVHGDSGPPSPPRRRGLGFHRGSKEEGRGFHIFLARGKAAEESVS
jgi:hypothetical protein